MSPERELHMKIDRAVRIVMGNLQKLADEAGVSYSSLRAWADGRRNPSPENLAKLADALEERGGELTDLARELREAAGEG